MTKLEFLNGIEKIESAYNTKFDNNKLKDWYFSLNDIDYNRYICRIEELRKTSKYIPSIADIRNEDNFFGYKNYDQRNPEDIDFNSFYAN